MKSEVSAGPSKNMHLWALTALAGSALVAAACSGGGEVLVGTGGANSATGGSATGGAISATGGSATGGTNSATGGSATGGTVNATGGAISATGGSATGGTISATGGSATGGSATGGTISATGGTAVAAGGSATGGTNSVTGGSATAGTDSATGGTVSATGGTVSTTGGSATAGAAGNATVLCNGDDCCPDDPNKTQPGVCGCGVSDSDTDADGTPDCKDQCVTDKNKTEPGICGCGGSEVDTDKDGTPDCDDRCPRDSSRTTPGICGCGVADSAAPYCLVHRYSFNGSSTTVTDSVGTANGKTVNVSLPGTGSLTLAGGTTDQYVELPNGIISALGDSATFEAWITWSGSGVYWQRVFDFGTNENGAGAQGTGTAFVFFTPLGSVGGPTLSVNTGGLTEATGTTAFPLGLTTGGQPHHVACVIDASSADATVNSAALYIDGTLIQKTTPLQSVLSSLTDVNNWLGRSQFSADPEFAGTYYEFRIYSAALTQSQITADITAGPDKLP